MNYNRLLLTICFALLSITGVYAQTNQLRITGFFEPSTTCRVNYSISPTPFLENMVFELNVTEAIELEAHIITTEGVEKLSIEDPSNTGRTGKNINISSLAPGNYYVEIVYGINKSQNYRIPFTKS